MKFLFVVFAIFIAAVSANYGHQQAHYGGHQHVQAYGHQAHTYAAHAPKVDCGSSLLAGCVPVVAHVPCHPAHHGGHQYGHKEAPKY